MREQGKGKFTHALGWTSWVAQSCLAGLLHKCGIPNLVFFCSRSQNGSKTGSLKFGNK
jgi:hypothetical protein